MTDKILIDFSLNFIYFFKEIGFMRLLQTKQTRINYYFENVYI